MKIRVIGAGAWGTAMAVHAARLHAAGEVSLWARDAQQAETMRQTRQNARYLPGVALPKSLRVCEPGENPAPDASSDASCQLILLGTPSSALETWLSRLQEAGLGQVPVVWLSKGFIATADPAQPFSLAHEVARRVAPGLMTGVLTGPSFAQEVATGKPSAIVAASAHAPVRDALVRAFHGGSLRVYANDDVIGAEVGGAVKNVLAIATGLCDGLDLGLNARAALITRGLAEMTRLGVALGARPDTFMGLTGLGDLVLTATGDLSRNRQVGLQLAQGKSLQQAVESLGHVAEGVKSAAVVLGRAQSLHVDMPITAAVVALVQGRLSPKEAVVQLMGRQARNE